MEHNKTKHLQQLALKVLTGKASEEEKLFLEEYYNAFEKHPDAPTEFTPDELQELRQSILQKIHKRTAADIDMPRRRHFRMWRRAAAAILIIMAGAAFFIFRQNHAAEPMVTISPSPTPASEVLPGGNRATLTLHDGSTILLDEAATGSLAQQGNIQVRKEKDGQLVYTASGKQGSPDNIQYNIVATPKGGQYQVHLPDGTKVWLNAASSIRFPTGFTGKERAVSVSGEAYFEVAHNARQPFVVTAGETIVQVLGTRFNIMAYDNEEMTKTTLAEGAVKISDAGRTAMLRPGEQMQVNAQEFKLVKHADVEAELAWRNGLFHFKNAGIRAVMKQVERWYNISVEYEGSLPEKQFNGKVPRNVNLSELMEILSFYDDMQCTIEHNTISIKRRS